MRRSVVQCMILAKGENCDGKVWICSWNWFIAQNSSCPGPAGATLCNITRLGSAGTGTVPAGQSVAYASSGPSAPYTSNAPDATCPAGGQCFTDVPSSNPFYAFINRIYQQDLVTGYPCGGTGEPCDAAHRPYYRPVNNVTRQQMAKFIDNARRLPQIDIETSTDASPVIVTSSAPNSDGIIASGTKTRGYRTGRGARCLCSLRRTRQQ